MRVDISVVYKDIEYRFTAEDRVEGFNIALVGAEMLLAGADPNNPRLNSINSPVIVPERVYELVKSELCALIFKNITFDSTRIVRLNAKRF